MLHSMMSATVFVTPDTLNPRSKVYQNQAFNRLHDDRLLWGLGSGAAASGERRHGITHEPDRPYRASVQPA